MLDEISEQQQSEETMEIKFREDHTEQSKPMGEQNKTIQDMLQINLKKMNKRDKDLKQYMNKINKDFKKWKLINSFGS